jgi:hypothetical protein
MEGIDSQSWADDHYGTDLVRREAPPGYPSGVPRS